MSRWLFVTIALALAALGVSLWLWFGAYDSLPAQVPTHWGWSGEPDAWTPRADLLPMLLLMPGFLGVWVLLTLALPWLSPKQFEVSAFRPTYELVMALTAGLFAYLHGIILAGYLVPGFDVGRWIVAGIFGFFAVLGMLLTRVRPNFWVGVRTPWTLASPIVWERTHRLAAWLFVGAGVLGLAAMLANLSMAIGFALLLIAALTPVVYSLVIYKQLEREGRLEIEPRTQ